MMPSPPPEAHTKKELLPPEKGEASASAGSAGSAAASRKRSHDSQLRGSAGRPNFTEHVVDERAPKKPAVPALGATPRTGLRWHANRTPLPSASSARTVVDDRADAIDLVSDSSEGEADTPALRAATAADRGTAPTPAAAAAKTIDLSAATEPVAPIILLDERKVDRFDPAASAAAPQLVRLSPC
jgi:hypothetical protein